MTRMKLLLILLIPNILGACATATFEQRTKVLGRAPIPNRGATELKESNQARLAIAQGQWVSFLLESKTGDNDLILRTIRILEVNDKRVIVQLESYSALEDSRQKIEQYNIDSYPVQPFFTYTPSQLRVAMANLDYDEVLVKEVGKKLDRWPKQLLFFSKNWSRKIFMTGYALDSPRTKKCRNEYFFSKRCYEYRHILKILNYKSAGRVIAHSAVPILGFLESFNDDAHIKVIAFGNNFKDQFKLDKIEALKE